MRIVREQMLCVILPDWPGAHEYLQRQALQQELKEMLRSTGFVHFASLALLPPAESNTSGLPSLMFEIVVNEGTTPEVVFNRLAHHPGGALWELYQDYFQDIHFASIGERNNELRDVLMRHVSVADGGFVGPRDRYVSQIRKERHLYRNVRSLAREVKQQRREERATFGSSLARLVLRKRSFEWVNEPSPKSFWRAQGGTAKFAVFGSIALLVYAAVWAAFWGSMFFDRLWASLGGLLPGVLHAAGHSLIAAATCAARWVTDIMGRAVVVALVSMAAIAAYVYLFWLLNSIVGFWHRWFARLGRELDRPTDSWSARVTYVLAWLTVCPVALVTAAALFYIVAGPEPLARLLYHYGTQTASGLHVAALWYGACYFVLLLILAVALRPASASAENKNDGWLKHRLKAAQRWFFRPSEDAVERAQQVHPTIEQCEARLVAGTAHMVSLTDLRWPYAWSAFWTRASLWSITTIGYFFYTEGKLGDAPGIQFSHWHICDGGRRLLFCANFDGTFGGYLDDFIKGPSAGTTLFWRWSELHPRKAAVPGHPAVQQLRRFPPTRLLVFRGVRCEQKFKTYARESMLPHLFRFVAHDLTLEQKNRATELRDALSGERTDAKDDLIMRCLES